MENYCVYKHTFPNNKVYIGITSMKPEKRWGRDGKGYRRKQKGRYTQPLMAKATLKYKWDEVIHEILFEGLTKEEAEAKEIELIAFYKSDQKEFGYNIEHGGSVNKFSEEQKKKISETLKGTTLPEETKKKISDSLKGKPKTEEHRRKASEGRQKSVICVETGEVYKSITEAAEKTGACKTHISAVARHKRQTAGGFHWSFCDELTNN